MNDSETNDSQQTMQTLQKKSKSMSKIIKYKCNICAVTFILIAIECHICTSKLESFNLSSTSFPQTIYDSYSAYNSESDYPDCIFVFGGYTGEPAEELYCFSISNHSLIEFDTFQVLTANLLPKGNPSALMWRNETDGDDYIYYVYRQSSNPYIKRYNLDKRENEYLATLDGFIGGACMQFNPFNTSEILLVEAYGDAFGVFNIDDNTFTLGETLDHAIKRQSCVAIDNEYMNDEPYFYVFGYGYIQRLNLNSGSVTANTAWETVQGSLEVSDENCDADWSVGSEIRQFRSILFSNLIYLIGGHDGSNTFDCIISYNILTNTSNYIGSFPTAIRLFTAMLSNICLFCWIRIDRMFVLGILCFILF